MKKRLLQILSWAAVLLWMALIFYLSSQVASQSDLLSKGLAQAFFDNLQKILPFINIESGFANHIVRKAAHFFAYLILGVLVMNALRKNGIIDRKAFAIALGICVLYAISDEIHQLYVPGRSGQVKDVLIDSAGAMTGVLSLCYLPRKKILR